MRLWMSGEVNKEVLEPFRLSMIYVEDEINSVIENKDYDIALQSWDCIAVLMKKEEDRKRYCEIIKYSPNTQGMDFRLQIDYPDFVNGNTKRQQQLIYEMLMRSLDLLIQKGLNETGIESLRQDTQSVALKHGWITAH